MRPGKGRAGTGKEQCAISEWESNSESTKRILWICMNYMQAGG